jgi:hypothetical protein
MTLQKFRKVQDVNRNGLNIKEGVIESVAAMESSYYNVVALASYGGLNKFRSKGYTKKETKDRLQTQDAHTLHKPTRRRFPRRQVVVYGIDHQWQAELVDLGKLASYNKGFKYLLTCIDVIEIRMGRSVERQDGKKFKRSLPCHFQDGSTTDTPTVRSWNQVYKQSVSEISEGKRCPFLYHV